MEYSVEQVMEEMGAVRTEDTPAERSYQHYLSTVPNGPPESLVMYGLADTLEEAREMCRVMDEREKAA